MIQQLRSILKLHRQLLPILLLTVYCMDALIASYRGTINMAGMNYDFEFTWKHGVALGAVLINVACYFFLRQFYKYTLALTILVGLLGSITFPAIETKTAISIIGMKIQFQPSAWWAGFLTYIINVKRVHEFLFTVLARKD